MKLTPKEIYGYARGAGFTVGQAVVATAIAMAESTGGDPNAHNPGTSAIPEDSRGLWQINVKAHPQYAGWNLYDPATNAKAAYAVSNHGKNFVPWSTYGTAAQYGRGHTNSYAGYLSEAAAAAGSPAITGPTQTTGGDTSSAGGVASTIGNVLTNPLGTLFGSLTSGVTKDVYRIAVSAVLVLGGAALVVVGLNRSVQSPVQKVANVGGNGGVTAKASKVAKVAAVA